MQPCARTLLLAPRDRRGSSSRFFDCTFADIEGKPVSLGDVLVPFDREYREIVALMFERHGQSLLAEVAS
jgi:hypothetical protein